MNWRTEYRRRGRERGRVIFYTVMRREIRETFGKVEGEDFWRLKREVRLSRENRDLERFLN